MSNPNFDPSSPQSLLPVVSPGIHASVYAEMAADPQYELKIFGRILTEQPVLGEVMSRFILGYGDTDEEKIRMRTVFVMAYRMLESQAEANATRAVLPDISIGEIDDTPPS